MYAHYSGMGKGSSEAGAEVAGIETMIDGILHVKRSHEWNADTRQPIAGCGHADNLKSRDFDSL